MKYRFITHRLKWDELWHLSGRKLSRFIFLIPVKLFKLRTVDKVHEVSECFEPVDMDLDVVRKSNQSYHKDIVDAGFTYLCSEVHYNEGTKEIHLYSGERMVITCGKVCSQGYEMRCCSVTSLDKRGQKIITSNENLGMKGPPEWIYEFREGYSFSSLLARHRKRMESFDAIEIDKENVKRVIEEGHRQKIKYNLDRGVLEQS